MQILRAGSALILVAIATVLGIVGTGLLFTAITDHRLGALLFGLPLTLGGLYWCGRALAESQRLATRRRMNSSSVARVAYDGTVPGERTL
jgi:hypothetical protein